MRRPLLRSFVVGRDPEPPTSGFRGGIAPVQLRTPRTTFLPHLKTATTAAIAQAIAVTLPDCTIVSVAVQPVPPKPTTRAVAAIRPALAPISTSARKPSPPRTFISL